MWHTNCFYQKVKVCMERDVGLTLDGQNCGGDIGNLMVTWFWCGVQIEMMGVSWRGCCYLHSVHS